MNEEQPYQKSNRGRKAKEDPKQPVTYYMYKSEIDAVGGMEAMRAIATEHCKQIAKDKAAWADITVKYGATHNIQKRLGTEVELKDLKQGQSVVFGDGETFYWLLAKKDQLASDTDTFESMG